MPLAIFMRLRRSDFLSVLFFFSLLSTALVFPLSLFIVRIFDAEKIQHYIDVQSLVAFFSFVFQLGLRAGIRNAWHKKKRYFCEEIDRQLPSFMLGLSMVAFLVELVFPIKKLYLAFSVVQAYLTIAMGLNIAKPHRRTALLYVLSILLTNSALSYGLWVSVGQAKYELGFFYMVEILSIVYLFLVFAHKGFWSFDKKIWFSILYFFPINVSSFFVYLYFFVLAQVVVYISSDYALYGRAYADVQIASGMISLIASKIFLMKEGEIYDSGGIYKLIGVSVAISVMASALAFCLSLAFYKDIKLSLLYFLFGLFLFAKFPLGLIVQFFKRSEQIWVFTTMAACSLLVALSIYSGTYFLCVQFLSTPLTLLFLIFLIRRINVTSGSSRGI